MARVRSPSYPSYSLEDAIENVGKVFEKDRTNPVDREVVANHLGYSGLNGAADKALGTLMQYRLLEKVAKGEVRVSQLAVDIMYPDRPEQKRNALLECAYAPALFTVLRDRFSGGVPSSSALKSYLLREGYNDRAIGPIITAYSKTSALLERENASESGGRTRPEEAESLLPDDEGVTYGGATVGDFVQWESNGALQFSTPLRVRFISEDGAWVAVEGSETGIPMDEVIVETPAPAVNSQAPQPAPTFPMERPQEQKQAEGFEEWFRAKVGSAKQVMISYRGDDDIGAKEIQKLIDILAAQKKALDE